MGETLNDLRIRLINRITSITDANLLLLIERLLDSDQTSEESLALLGLAGAVKEKTLLSELVAEQQYRGPNRAAFDQAVERLHLREPLDELLAQLTK